MKAGFTVLLAAQFCVAAAALSGAEETAAFLPDCSWSASWSNSEAHAVRGAADSVPPKHNPIVLQARPRPDAGERFHLEGSTILSIVIDSRGKVADVRIVRSAATPRWPKYEAALLKAVRKMRFTPGTLKGEPVTFCDRLDVLDQPTFPR